MINRQSVGISIHWRWNWGMGCNVMRGGKIIIRHGHFVWIRRRISHTVTSGRKRGGRGELKGQNDIYIKAKL